MLFAFGLGQVLPQTPDDVLHHDDGVVHQGTKGNRHAAQGHGVDGGPERLHRQDGSDQRQGDGHQGDQRGASRQQEGEDDGNNQDGPVAQGDEQVVDRGFDEIRLTEDVALDLHACRQACLDVRQAAVKPVGQLQRIGPGLLLDAQHHRRLAVMGANTTLWRSPDADLGDVTDQDGLPIADRDDCFCNVVQHDNPALALDQILLTRFHIEAGRGVLIGLA